MSEQRGGDRYLKRLYGHLCCKIWVGVRGGCQSTQTIDWTGLS